MQLDSMPLCTLGLLGGCVCARAALGLSPSRVDFLGEKRLGRALPGVDQDVDVVSTDLAASRPLPSFSLQTHSASRGPLRCP